MRNLNFNWVCTRTGVGVSLFAAVLSSEWASATPIANSTNFLPGPINITFDTPAPTPDAPVTTQYQSLGATFSGLVGGDTGISVPNGDNFNVQDFISNGPNFQPVNIYFNTPVTYADFSLTQQPGTALITSYLAGVQVEQFTATTANLFQTNNIEGFENTLIDQISVVVSSSDHADIIDNLQFTPEPASMSLLAPGALGLLARRRRA